MVVVTPLEFVEDAICLSGLTGTKLKSDVIGQYYPFWWGITSTGEVYIEDTMLNKVKIPVEFMTVDEDDRVEIIIETKA